MARRLTCFFRLFVRDHGEVITSQVRFQRARFRTAFGKASQELGWASASPLPFRTALLEALESTT